MLFSLLLPGTPVLMLLQLRLLQLGTTILPLLLLRLPPPGTTNLPSPLLPQKTSPTARACRSTDGAAVADATATNFRSSNALSSRLA